MSYNIAFCQKDRHPGLITKHDFYRRKHKSVSDGSFPLPPPFVVRTQLEVKDFQKPSNNQRQGRTYQDDHGAIVVEGVRVPDDSSDRLTWRGGKVIGNVFYPDNKDQRLPRQGKAIGEQQVQRSSIRAASQVQAKQEKPKSPFAETMAVIEKSIVPLLKGSGHAKTKKVSGNLAALTVGGMTVLASAVAIAREADSSKAFALEDSEVLASVSQAFKAIRQ